MNSNKEYFVRVTYNDLHVENEYTEDKSYKSSLNLYGELKSKLDINAIKVELVKIQNEQEFITYVKKKKKVKKDDCRTIIFDILDNIQKVKSDYNYYCTMLTMYDKRRSTYLHMIENLDMNDYKDFDEELRFNNNLMESMKENENDRRYAKLQIKNLKDVITKLESIESDAVVQNYANFKNSFNMSAYEIGILSHLDVQYTDEKDKKNVISTYEKEYKNYIDDYKNKTICFYNHLGHNKHKKPVTKIDFETKSKDKSEKLIVKHVEDVSKSSKDVRRTVFDYTSNSMKKMFLKQNKTRYKYHKVDTREKE